MEVLVNYQKLKNYLPEITAEVEQKFLAKRMKSKKKDEISFYPENWQWSLVWAQRIYPFNENKSLSEESPAQKVYELFKKGDIAPEIVASVKSVKAMARFPDFASPDFYVPEEMVKYYGPSKDYSNNTLPTLFVYMNDNNSERLEEVIVIGGIKNKKTAEEYLVIENETLNSLVMKINHATSNLESVTMLGSNITLEDFSATKEIRLNKITYITMTPENMLEKLGDKKQWILDKNSYVSMLLAALSGSSGFMQFGTLKPTQTITVIPASLKINYLNAAADPLLKEKLKIR